MRGYAVTYSELIPSVYGISAVVPARRAPAMSVGFSSFSFDDEQHLAAAVHKSARRLSQELS